MPTTVPCLVCRHANPLWRHHCGSCGNGLPVQVTACECGVTNEPEARFCGACACAIRRVAVGPVRNPPKPPVPLSKTTGTTTRIEVLEDVLIAESSIA